MDGRPTWIDCDQAGDYVVPNVLSPTDLVSRPDIMGETVLHTVAITDKKAIMSRCVYIKYSLLKLCNSDRGVCFFHVGQRL